eukprot:CAMPEP_0204021136 /NCGR_PEP_ID=MMETSP0360-20130528/29891_1 /ASSEMBLY_ACC=CAM_ASM_000342 /TAXON_ID=268821 /ORGANISM="Scrippsiella Hangoei, Strain SHTV-5" /LENGTH=114 /DNA_ID=CAMNT_0050964505 /DNA_START=63 /DNA_END=406 /DNA_ORIENTATION=-
MAADNCVAHNLVLLTKSVIHPTSAKPTRVRVLAHPRSHRAHLMPPMVEMDCQADKPRRAATERAECNGDPLADHTSAELTTAELPSQGEHDDCDDGAGGKDGNRECEAPGLDDK